MPIVTPGKRPGERMQKSRVFGKKGFARKKSGYSNLNLTPMVDMFTIIVIYLIMNFSTNGDILFMTKEIQLPQIASHSELERAPVVSVSAEAISVDGEKIIDTAEVLAMSGMEVPVLSDKMQEKKRLIQQGGALFHGKQFSGQINFQVDKGLQFKVLKRVMYACNVAGFNNVNFAGLLTSVPGAAPKTASNP